MTRFATELREAAERLREVPEPTRSRILLELRGDLEDLSASLRADGLDEQEARDRAVGTLLPDPGAVADLAEVHRPLYQRLVDRFSVPTRNRVERALLAGLVVVVLAGGGGTLARLDLFTEPSGFLAPVLLVGAAGLALGLAKLSALFVTKEHGRRGLRRGMSLLPSAVSASLVLGLAGTTVDLYQAAGRIADDPAAAPRYAIEWIRRDVALLSVTLVLASLVALAWFLASIRIARIEQAEAEVFTAWREPGPADPALTTDADSGHGR